LVQGRRWAGAGLFKALIVCRSAKEFRGKLFCAVINATNVVAAAWA
jgi:hypothetical protein